jgi:hypothetical protein
MAKQGLINLGGFRVLNVENDQYTPYSNFEVLYFGLCPCLAPSGRIVLKLQGRSDQHFCFQKWIESYSIGVTALEMSLAIYMHCMYCVFFKIHIYIYT